MVESEPGGCVGGNLRERKVIHGTITGYTGGGCRCDACAAAGKEWRRKRQEKKRAMRPPNLPVEPLYGLLDDSNRREISKYLNRYGSRGIPIYRADYWCCRLGVHPWMVYGDLYFKDLWEGEQNVE